MFGLQTFQRSAVWDCAWCNITMHVTWWQMYSWQYVVSSTKHYCCFVYHSTFCCYGYCAILSQFFICTVHWALQFLCPVQLSSHPCTGWVLNYQTWLIHYILAILCMYFNFLVYVGEVWCVWPAYYYSFVQGCT